MNLFVIRVCLYKFQEYCQLVPNEVCNDIVKEYPSLTIANECQYTPRQTCSEDDVKPKEVIKHITSIIESNIVKTVSGNTHKIKFDTFCVHSDTNNSIEILKEINKVFNNR